MENFGEVISSYSARQGIEDGMFVEPFPLKYPGLLFTVGVHTAIEAKIEGLEQTYAQAAIPFIMDAQMIVRKCRNEDLWTKGLDGNVTGKTV